MPDTLLMTRYLISDLHFNDQDAIDDFDRPFTSLDEMHTELKNRWNSVVSASDQVIVVGDFARVEREAEVWIWLSQLSGEIILVDGNHRPINRSEFGKSRLPLTTEYRFEEGGYSFRCAHKPKWFPEEWDGWKIYGHFHNQYPDQYPFIDPEKRRINVSAELLDYTPVSIGRIIELLNEGDKHDTLPNDT